MRIGRRTGAILFRPHSCTNPLRAVSVPRRRLSSPVFVSRGLSLVHSCALPLAGCSCLLGPGHGSWPWSLVQWCIAAFLHGQRPRAAQALGEQQSKSHMHRLIVSGFSKNSFYQSVCARHCDRLRHPGCGAFIQIHRDHHKFPGSVTLRVFGIIHVHVNLVKPSRLRHGCDVTCA